MKYNINACMIDLYDIPSPSMAVHSTVYAIHEHRNNRRPPVCIPCESLGYEL